MIAVLCSIVVSFFSWVLPAITQHNQFITVPDLTGMHADALHEFLAQRNLRLSINQDVAYATNYPPSVVLAQYPQAGAHVKEGRSIYITLNAAQPPDVSVPNLVDSSLKQAQALLQNYGLTMGTVTYVPDIAENAVLAQYHQGQLIAPGACVVQGTSIDLVVGASLDNTTQR